MNHEDALNEILAHACPREFRGAVRVYQFDLHCSTATVTAQLTGITDEKIQYDILSVQIEAESSFDFSYPDMGADIIPEVYEDSDRNTVTADWINENAEPNGIGPVCKYCDRLIDGEMDHSTTCPAGPYVGVVGEKYNVVQVNELAVLFKPSPTVTQERKNMSYYGSSTSSLVDSLRDKVQTAEEQRDELSEAQREIEDALEELATFIDDMETLINNLDEMPTVSVRVSVDVDFDSDS